MKTSQLPYSQDPSLQNDRLFGACLRGDLIMALDAIEKGADMNHFDHDTGWTPLHVAAKNSFVGLMQSLVEKGADPNIRSLPSSKPSFEISGCTPLMLSFDSPGILNLLVQRTQLEIQDAGGNTVLHRAARFSSWSNVLALLQAGAPREIKNDAGRTPFQEAAFYLREAITDPWQSFKASEKAMDIMNQTSREARCSVKPL